MERDKNGLGLVSKNDTAFNIRKANKLTLEQMNRRMDCLEGKLDKVLHNMGHILNLLHEMKNGDN